MNNGPSFFALFCRSRFAGADLAEEKAPSGKNRRELFAVGAVAHLAQFNPAFKERFLLGICGIDRSLQSNFSIKLQPAHYADLLVSSETEVFIIEFKIGAKLLPKQHPEKLRAFNGPQGYGHQIEQNFPAAKYKRVSYIVVQRFPAFSNGHTGRIDFKSRGWKELAKVPQGESPEETDLFETLAMLGVESLRKIQHMKKARKTKDAVELHTILTAVAEDLGYTQRQLEKNLEIACENLDYWYGFDIPPKLKGHSKLLKQVGAKAPNSAGWFGFQKTEAGRFELAIWLYCASKAAMKMTKKFLHAHLPENFSREIRVDGNSLYLVIDSDRHGLADDREWFTARLDALADGSG